MAANLVAGTPYPAARDSPFAALDTMRFESVACPAVTTNCQWPVLVFEYMF